MNTGALFYFPTMHPELAPAGLPEGILFLSPGLAPLPADAPAALRSFVEALPFSPREAAQVLRDMLQTAEERGLDSPAPQEHPLSAQRLRQGEGEALNDFSLTGNVTPAASDEERRLLDRRTSWHKLLLLAYSLEEQAAKIREVEERLHRSEAALDALLQETPAPRTQAGPEDFTPPYHRLLAAAAAFLPHGAALYASDQDVVRQWREITTFTQADAGLISLFPALDGKEILAGLPQVETASGTVQNILLFVPAV